MNLTIQWILSLLTGITLMGCSLSKNLPLTPVHREVLIEGYLNEFVSPAIKTDYPNIYEALKNVLHTLPENVFEEITRRNRPVIFVNSVTSGIARYAQSTEVYIPQDEPAAFQEGFYLVILGDELNLTQDIQAIEGVILHELAHRHLEHLRKEIFSCAMEKEANHLVMQWGFEKEFKKAKKLFGSKHTSDSPCADQAEKIPDVKQ